MKVKLWNNKINALLVLVAVIMLSFLFSCNDESFFEGTPNLSLSTDTVSFDTIFTTQGSATYHFTIHNPHNKPVNIDRVELIGGDNSQFRINVDGIQKRLATDVEVLAKDSIYVFVEVTVDPQNANLPVLIADSILIEADKNVNYVKLLAYGQDAYHVKAERGQDYVLWFSQTLKNDKPYLIHDPILLDSLSELKINPGTRLFFRQNTSLHIQGTITVKGTQDAPVVFRGARTDDVFNGFSYSQVPGQWGYIHLRPGSRNNVFNYAEIRNSIIGIQVDTVVTENPTLTIKNSIIESVTGYGLYAQGAHVEAKNCLFANCGQVAVALTIGGKYDFTHCTIGNYYNFSNRRDPSLYLNNFYIDINDQIQARDLVHANFYNCIIYGNNSDELLTQNEFRDVKADAEFNYTFDHCLIKAWQNVDTTDRVHFKNVIWNKDPKFIDPKPTETSNFQLDTLSSAKDKGDRFFVRDLRFDLLGNPRLIDDDPDLGAYERVEE